MSASKPTRPEVEILLDCPRTLKLDFNATVVIREATISKLHPKGIGWIVASGTFCDYFNACVSLGNLKVADPDRELSAEEIDAMEPPTLLIRGILYALLQHQWLADPPLAPRLTVEDVGRLIPFEDAIPLCGKIMEAITQNSVPPAGTDIEAKTEERPANGQSPLSPPMEPITTTTAS